MVKSQADFDKPFIAVCNSFVQIIPGHAHLDVVGKKVRDAMTSSRTGLSKTHSRSMWQWAVPLTRVLHTLAIAIEAGQPFDLAHLNEVSARVPYICKVAPSGKYHMEDVYRAGGISAIL